MRTREMNQGFTLIELLIVVAIIAILAAIAVPNFLEAQTRSKVSRTRADMRTVQTGLEAYAVDYNFYPPSWDRNANGWIPLNIQRLTPLTTPVAFLTTIPLDVFVSGKSQNEHFGFTTGPDGPMAYHYAEDHYPPRAIRRSFSPNSQPDAGYVSVNGNNVAWKLQSTGPDAQYNWFGYPNGNPVLDNNNDRFLIETTLYDPSNGTISTGDIIIFGGSDKGSAG